jgi:hypothetical protein
VKILTFCLTHSHANIKHVSEDVEKISPLEEKLFKKLFRDKSKIFWYITLCSPWSVNPRFEGTYRLHLQAQKIGLARNQHASRCQEDIYYYEKKSTDTKKNVNTCVLNFKTVEFVVI